MIHLFGKNAPVLFPKSWANSVTRWLMGIYSPKGTITIKNTADPGEGGSVALDVNIEAIASHVERRLDARGLTDTDRIRVREIIRGLIDGDSIIYRDKHIMVDMKWIEEFVKGLQDGGEAKQPSSTSQMPSGSGMGPSRLPVSDSGATFGAPGGAGVVVHLACRSMNDGTYTSVFYRPFTITSDGRIYAIGQESMQQTTTMLSEGAI